MAVNWKRLLKRVMLDRLLLDPRDRRFFVCESPLMAPKLKQALLCALLTDLNVI
jgi:hypothetical protein